MPKPIKTLYLLTFFGIFLHPLFANSRLPDLPRSRDRISTQDKLFIKTFVFEGNTIFSDDRLAEIAAEYKGSMIAIEKIHELRDKITKLYIEKGYINSGVIVKDQTITDDALVMTVIEGRVGKINLKGNRRLRDHYILSRMERGITAPINIFRLQKPLQLLQQDPMIQRTHSKLAAGPEPGEGILEIEVIEASPYQLGFIFDNYRSPSTGSYRGKIYGSYSNLSGWGETIGGSFGLTEGADDFDVNFSLPLTRWDTQLSGSYQESDSTIITDVFHDLDIDSKSKIFNLTLRQPVYRSQNRELTLFASLDRKRSKTFLLGEAFSFSSGVVEGVSKITILNFGQEFVKRSQRSVLALRSNFGFGVDWLDATVIDPSDPTFIHWLGQFQFLSHIPIFNGQVLVRAALRATSDQLAPLEKFGIGGRDTVRGYRQNEITGDNGTTSGVEFRFPIGKIKIPKISQSADDGDLHFIPFFDYGRVWGADTEESDDFELYSIGVGFRWRPQERIMAEIFWGHKLKSVNRDGDHDLQDEGIHFQISAALF